MTPTPELLNALKQILEKLRSVDFAHDAPTYKSPAWVLGWCHAIALNAIEDFEGTSEQRRQPGEVEWL